MPLSLLPDRYRNGMRVAVAGSAAPYGYTLTVWTSGAILIHEHGRLPTTIDALLFIVGAVSGFAVVGALAYGGVRRPMGRPETAFSLWRSFHFLTISAAIGAAWLVAHALGGRWAWPVDGFLMTFVYLVGVGIHLAHEDGAKQSPAPGA